MNVPIPAPATPLNRVSATRPLGGLVSRQMNAVAKDWAGLLGVSTSYEAPAIQEMSADGLPKDLPWPLAATTVEVESEDANELSGRFCVMMRVMDAVAICAPLLGKPAPNEAEPISLDPETQDALNELFNLFCGATDRAVRRGTERPVHVKQLATRQVSDAAELESLGVKSDGWLSKVTMKVADRPGIHIWQVIPLDLGNGLARWQRNIEDAELRGGGTSVGKAIPGKGAILVVDDLYSIRKIIRWHLENEGYEVHEAGNGKEALKVLEKTQPVAMILDVMMPQMDGYEVARCVRRMTNGKQLAIIMCTCKGEQRDIVEAIKAGANDYIVKPFSRATLLAKVANAIQGRAAVQR